MKHRYGLLHSRAMARGLGALILALVAGASSCDASAPQEPGPATTSVPQAPVSPEPSDPAGSQFVKRTDLPWQDLGVWPDRGFGGVYVVSLRYFVRQTENLNVAEVIRRSDGKVVARHESTAPEFETIFADIAGDRVVIVDEDNETGPGNEKDIAQAYVYDLSTGRRTPLSAIRSAPPLSVFGAQANVTDDGRYYYSANVDGRLSNCVGLLDLETLRARTADCAGDGENESIYYVRSGDGGATWLHVAGPTFDSCRKGRAVRDGEVVTMGPRNGCSTLGTTTVGDWDVRSWGSPDPKVPIEAVNGGLTIDLGMVDSVNLTECGGWAYWRLDDDESRTTQIRRWRPNHEPEIAYSVEKPADTSPAIATPVLAGCADDILTLRITRMHEDETWTTQVLILSH